MKDLEFHLSVQDANQIIKALGQLPYMQVHELIAKIHLQASQQLPANGNGINANGKTQSAIASD